MLKHSSFGQLAFCGIEVVGVLLTEEEVIAQDLPLRDSKLPSSESSGKKMTMQDIGIISAIFAFFLVGMVVLVKKFIVLKKGQDQNRAVKSDEQEIEENAVVEEIQAVDQKSAATEKADLDDEPEIPIENVVQKIAADVYPNHEQPAGSSLIDPKDIKLEVGQSQSDIYKYKVEQDLEA